MNDENNTTTNTTNTSNNNKEEEKEEQQQNYSNNENKVELRPTIYRAIAIPSSLRSVAPFLEEAQAYAG